MNTFLETKKSVILYLLSFLIFILLNNILLWLVKGTVASVSFTDFHLFGGYGTGANPALAKKMFWYFMLYKGLLMGLYLAFLLTTGNGFKYFMIEVLTAYFLFDLFHTAAGITDLCMTTHFMVYFASSYQTMAAAFYHIPAFLPAAVFGLLYVIILLYSKPIELKGFLLRFLLAFISFLVCVMAYRYLKH